jgi:nicotinamide-nucleotide amidase
LREAFGFGTVARDSPAALTPTLTPMRIEILTIGNEILSGRTLDTNFAMLARALEEVSVQVTWHSTVGDVTERIGEALGLALERADGVVVTGGLGPTPDDVTRKAVANALGRPLRLNEHVLESIHARARRLGRKLPASVETQALVPTGAQIWENRLGTAPGLLIVHQDKPIILLPGVPQEMEGLAREFAVPYLRERTGQRVESFTIRTAGTFESRLQERIGAAPQKWANASLAYLPSYFGVDLRVTVAGDDAKQVEETAARAHRELKALVEPVVYAEGSKTMDEIVGELLVEKKMKIAVAESCTGGLLSKRLTDIAGSSRYFERGFVTYSNDSKVELLGVRAEDIATHGAVSAPVAEQMAAGAAARAKVQVGVSITGIAGPDGGTETKPVGTVFVGVHTPDGNAVRLYSMTGGTRHTIRERSAQMALDLVRRKLMGLPLDARLE